MSRRSPPRDAVPGDGQGGATIGPMKTPTTRPAEAPPAPPPAARRPAGADSWLASAAAVAVLALVVMGFFLWIFPAKGYRVPMGWDQSEYLWRTRYAQVVGLTHIDQAPGSARSAKSGRPAYPVIGATLSSLSGTSPFRVAVVLPSVMAAVIGLAAAAFVAGLLRRPPWQLAVAALAVSLSPVVIRLMQPEGYMDNMFAAAVFLAAAIPLALALEDRAALLPAILLLGAGATIHWAFFGFMGAVLLLTGAAYAPASWTSWRSGRTRLLDTPTARIGEGLVGGAVIGTGMIFAVLGNGLPKARVDVSEFTKKLRSDLPKYRFPFTLPLAAVGGAALIADSRDRAEQPRRSRFLLAFLLAWCAVVAAGYVAKVFLHLAVPAHRFLAFALAIPVLGVIGILWGARLLAKVNRILAAALVVAAVVLMANVAHGEWFAAKSWIDPAKVRDAATTAAYLEAAHVPPGRPVVFIVQTRDWSAAALFGHMIRATIPPDRIRDVYVYVGSAASYRSHRPDASRISARYFQRVEPVYARHPVAVILSAFNQTYYQQWAGPHPDLVIRDRVAVVVGPRPPADIPSSGPPIGPPLNALSLPYLGALAAGVFAVLLLIGLGWTFVLLRRWLRPQELLAVAPAVGVAALVLGGIVIDRVGVRLVGVGGALAPVAIAGAGYAAAWLSVRRRGRPAVRA